MRFKVERLQLRVTPGNRAEREEEAQLRKRRGASVSRSIPRDRKTHAPRTGAWGTPAGGVVGLGSLVELELAIRVFANDKFKTEAWGTWPTTSSNQACCP